MPNNEGRSDEARLFRQLPEYDLFPDAETRNRAIRDLDRSLETNNRYWFQLISLVVLTALATYLVMKLSESFGWLPNWSALPIVVAGNVGMIWLIIWHWKQSIARRLRGKLIELRVPVCRACGYSMKAVSAPRCPECGWTADDAVEACLDLPRHAPPD